MSRIFEAGVAHGSYAARIRALTDADLAPLVRASTSVAQILAKLDMPLVGRAHHDLSRHLQQLGLDTSHFRGSGWANGETTTSHSSVAAMVRARTIPDDMVLVENSTYANGPRVARRLVKLGRSYRCEWCGIDEWRGQKLVLHLDHITA